MAREQIRLKLQNGKYIYGNCWKVENDKTSKANVVIAHGMCEYSARYDEFATYLNSQGYDVFAVDQPGHGLNVTAVENPELGLGVWPNSGFKLAIDYLYTLITQVRLTTKPIILFGHSMGSFISQRYYQRYSNTIDGLVLCGSSSNQPSFVIGRALSKIIKTFKNKKTLEQPCHFFFNLQIKSFNSRIKQYPDGYKTNSRFLSWNEENVKKYDLDPMCGFVPSFNFYFNLFGGFKPTFQKKRLKAIENKFPILLVSGKDDPLGGYGKYVKKLQKFYTKGKIPCEAKLYEHARHELLNEDIKKEVFTDIGNYMDLRVKEVLEIKAKKVKKNTDNLFN